MNYYNYEILINKIAWFIPFKTLRNFLRLFLTDLVKNFYRTEYLINVNNKIKQNDNLVILWVGGTDKKIYFGQILYREKI